MLSPSHPARIAVSRRLRTWSRRVTDAAVGPIFAGVRDEANLPVEILRHATPLVRRLKGVPEGYFENKGANLALAAAALDGLLIRPGETFSFWKCLGAPTEARGFRVGLVISGGRLERGIGGGLCQAANALHWMALHSELAVAERHRHSFDLFPDDDRQVPFGSGATVVYNYRDLRLRNGGGLVYQIRMGVREGELRARLLASAEPMARYRVFGRDEAFEPAPEGVYRSNTIVRSAQDREEEVLFKNRCRCLYEV